MSIQKIRKELNELLENVVAHSESFPENRPIPSLEISVVLSKINKMQENLAVLKYLLERQEKELKNSGKAHAITNESTKKTVSQIEITTETIEPNSVHHLEVENQMQTKEQPSEIAQKLQKTKLKSLKEAFSLNDRYLFANELFNKNMEAFNAAVKSLDECANIEEATHFFQNLKEKANWDDENTYFVAFMELIERRFS